MKRVKKVKLLGLFLFLGFMAVVSMAGQSYAAPIDSTGSATNFLFNFSTNNPLDWTAGAPGFDTRGSFSGGDLNSNGLFLTDGNAIDGAPWGNTTFSGSTGAATGNASTLSADGVTGILAAGAQISLTSRDTASAFTQAVFSGQFLAPAGTILNVNATYSLFQSLASIFGEAVSSSVSVGLVLSDFNGFDPNTGQSPILFSDIVQFDKTITDAGTFTFSQAGILNLLNIALDPTITYDFEAFASVNNTADPVPEPGTLLLVGSGMLGMAAFMRRKFGF